MPEGRPIFVVDTNVLVDYVDIIPGTGVMQPEEPTIDLCGAHLVIPTAVVRELSSFKKEKSDRGKAARVILRRLRELVEGEVHSMTQIYNLEAPIEVPSTDQLISVLPVHKNFKGKLAFSPSENDMDGQIILATLTVMVHENGCTIDEFLDKSGNIFMNRRAHNVTLLTNDNGLAIRARERGIKTSRYGYKYPKPYTGRRDLVVPKKLFDEFYYDHRIDYVTFKEFMPLEPDLAANEFIIMSLAREEDYPILFNPLENPEFCHIGRYDRDEDAIVALRYAPNFPGCIKTAGQAIYAEALMDPNISAVICTGPAGSGKTYMATIYGYNACRDGKFIGVTAVPCESRNDIGALPGDLDEKMDPDVQPLKNALRNYLLQEDCMFRKELENLHRYGTNGKCNYDSKGNPVNDSCNGKRSIKEKLKDVVNLIWSNWFSSIPIDKARGRDFAYELAIYDEFQDQNISQADTLIKRIGLDGKIVLTGDIHQIHAPYLDETNNGLVYASRLLYDDPMVAQVCFTDEEVVRHPLVKMIAKRQQENRHKP